MTDKPEKKLIPTWGYHATEAAKIFNLPEGDKLPKDWHSTPDRAQWPAEKPVPVSPPKGETEPKPQAKFTAIEGDKTK